MFTQRNLIGAAFEVPGLLLDTYKENEKREELQKKIKALKSIGIDVKKLRPEALKILSLDPNLNEIDAGKILRDFYFGSDATDVCDKVVKMRKMKVPLKLISSGTDVVVGVVEKKYNKVMSELEKMQNSKSKVEKVLGYGGEAIMNFFL